MVRVPDQDRSREDLVAELQQLRKRVAELEERVVPRDTSVRDDTAHVPLRLPEGTLEKLYRNRGLMISLSDLEEGRFLDVNDGFLRSTGYDRSEVLGRTSTEIGLVDQETRRAVKDRLLGRGRVGNLEVELRRKDGSPLHCLFFGNLVESDGAPKLLSIAIDVSARHEAEAALERAEELVKSVLKNARFGFFVVEVTHEGRFTLIGPRAPQPVYESLQPEPDNAEPLASPRDPSRIPVLRSILAKAIETRKAVADEHTTRVGRATKWWLTTVTPVLDDAGQVSRVVCSTVDVSDRRRMQQDLEESRKLYRTLFEASPTAVMVVQEGRYLFVNPVAARLLGYEDPGEVLGMQALATIAPESHEAVLTRMASAQAGQANPPVCMTILRRDGSRIVSESTSVPIDIGGRRATLVIGQDVTDKLAAQEALRESEARYRMLFAYAHDAIFVADPQTGAILDCNQRAEDLVGYSRQELCALSQWDLHPPAERDRYRRVFVAAVANEGQIVEVEVLHRDGRLVPVEISSGGVVKAGAREVHFGIFRDISERRAAEEQRKQLERQLVHSQKMEALGRLAGGIAHDFNNLLTGIIGNVSLARMDLSSLDPIHHTLAEIDEGARRAAALVRQILAFSRRQVLEARVIDPNDMLRELERLFGRLIGEDVEIVWDLGSPIGHVKVDPTQLEQVVVNLVVNARDAMPTGGRLCIRSRNAGDPSEPRVEIAFTDTGCGMDEATLERIFEPFFTTKQSQNGTGLGLATAYGIVSQHGGQIHVESAVGRGTTFTIALPSVREAVSHTPEPDRLHLPTGHETLLVVEDDGFVRKIAVKVLTRLGYDVHEAPGGPQALSVAQALDRPVDLLVTDIVMPRLNGRALAEALARLQPSLRVLFTSGYTEDVIGNHGVLRGRFDFIGKPYTPTDLARKVRDVLDRP